MAKKKPVMLLYVFNEHGNKAIVLLYVLKKHGEIATVLLYVFRNSWQKSYSAIVRT